MQKPLLETSVNSKSDISSRAGRPFTRTSDTYFAGNHKRAHMDIMLSAGFRQWLEALPMENLCLFKNGMGIYRSNATQYSFNKKGSESIGFVFHLKAVGKPITVMSNTYTANTTSDTPVKTREKKSEYLLEMLVALEDSYNSLNNITIQIPSSEEEISPKLEPRINQDNPYALIHTTAEPYFIQNAQRAHMKVAVCSEFSYWLSQHKLKELHKYGDMTLYRDNERNCSFNKGDRDSIGITFEIVEQLIIVKSNKYTVERTNPTQSEAPEVVAKAKEARSIHLLNTLNSLEDIYLNQGLALDFGSFDFDTVVKPANEFPQDLDSMGVKNGRLVKAPRLSITRDGVYRCDAVIEVGPDAFIDCKDILKELVLMNAKKLHDKAVSGCEKLKISILPQVKELGGNEVFFQCFLMKTLVVDVSMTKHMPVLKANFITSRLPVLVFVGEPNGMHKKMLYDSIRSRASIKAILAREFQKKDLPKTFSEIKSIIDGKTLLRLGPGDVKNRVFESKDITSVEHEACNGIEFLKEAILHETISIGFRAFYESSMEKFTAPKLENIGTEALGKLINLLKLDLPKVTYVESQAVKGSSKLKEASFPALEHLPVEMFAGCIALEKLTVHPSVTFDSLNEESKYFRYNIHIQQVIFAGDATPEAKGRMRDQFDKNCNSADTQLKKVRIESKDDCIKFWLIKMAFTNASLHKDITGLLLIRVVLALKEEVGIKKTEDVPIYRANSFFGSQQMLSGKSISSEEDQDTKDIESDSQPPVFHG